MSRKITAHTRADGRLQAVKRERGRFAFAGAPLWPSPDPGRRARAIVNAEAAGLASRGKPTSDERDKARAEESRRRLFDPLPD